VQQNPERLSEPLCLGEMAGIKEMRDELLGLLDEQLGFLDRSSNLTMPAYTSRFPGELSCLSGLFGALALEGSRAG